jgi:hypothetical protein
MITQVFPKVYQKYLDLPVLGPLMETYTAWLFEQQYTRLSNRQNLYIAAHVCGFLKSRGIDCVEDVSESDLEACYRLFRRKFTRAGSVRVLTRFLIEQGLVQPSPAPEPGPKEVLLNKFMDHLKDDSNTPSYHLRISRLAEI